jgi:hypothetical protein
MAVSDHDTCQCISAFSDFLPKKPVVLRYHDLFSSFYQLFPDPIFHFSDGSTLVIKD